MENIFFSTFRNSEKNGKVIVEVIKMDKKNKVFFKKYYFHNTS